MYSEGAGETDVIDTYDGTCGISRRGSGFFERVGG